MNFKTTFLRFPLLVTVMFCTFLIFDNTGTDKSPGTPVIKKMRSSGSPKAALNSVKGREEYLFKMLRDPKTNSIPPGILKSEMEFSKNIKSSGLRKTGELNSANWQEAGPGDVGGRTRALALDVRNSNTVIAGGVSGGIWKSTDDGETWELKLSTSQALSITSIAQDTRAGFENNWYASAGEYSGNTASAHGAFFKGIGLYKSTDNGETWQLTFSEQNDPTIWDHPLDYVSKIIINPQTGSFFFACNGGALYRYIVSAGQMEKVLGGYNTFIELDISTDGTIVAALSERSTSQNINPAHQSGVWMSENDGEDWTEITPQSYPVGTNYGRAVAAIAPSNPNICYLVLEADANLSNQRLYKFNLPDNTSEDLSSNLPNFDQINKNNKFATQRGYDLALAVKPDDENFVLLGGTNLYRSFDGFATPLNIDAPNQWIGGFRHDGLYNSRNAQIENCHPDIQSIVFDPQNLENVWVGTDGGLSFTDNISAKDGADYSLIFEWESKNNNYNVTQCYYVSLPGTAGDDRIIAGTQDNGTPFFRFDGSNTSESYDVSTGDGFKCYFGQSFAYTSFQYGIVIQLGYYENGKISNPRTNEGSHGAVIFPRNATGQEFASIFAVDPYDENIMYYPAGSSIWRFSSLNSIENGIGIDPQTGNLIGLTEGWTELSQIEIPEGYTYSSINVSYANDSHVLYYAACNADNKPLLYRLDNSNTSEGPAIDISIPEIVSGAFINDIAVNPENANEILVVATNYHIVGLYHSIDGGVTYSAVEGNLRGQDDKGPSLRSAEILPASDEANYFVGTSVGLFSATELDGESTIWTQEGADVIGNVVVADLDARTSDNYIAVGTHGRGVFTGTLSPEVNVKQADLFPDGFSLSQNYPNPFNPTTIIKYQIAKSKTQTSTSSQIQNVILKVFDTLGREVATLVNEYQAPGNYEVQFDGSSLSSGIYYYSLEAGGFVRTRKLMLLK